MTNFWLNDSFEYVFKGYNINELLQKGEFYFFSMSLVIVFKNLNTLYRTVVYKTLDFG